VLVLSLASLLQVAFLPGYLVWRLAGLRGSGHPLLLSLGLSLLLNHVLVVLLTLAGAYTRPVVVVLFLGELALLGWIDRHALIRPPRWPASFPLLTALGEVDAGFAPAWLARAVRLGLTAASVGFLIYFVYLCINNVGGVFNDWDPLVSYNRWARAWYEGAVPERTWTYPQLLPSVWSMTYMFLGTDRLQFVAQALSPVFALALVALPLDLAMRLRTWAFVPSAALVGILLVRFYHPLLLTAHADIPATFFVLLSLCVLLAAADRDKAARGTAVVFGATLAAGSALTKQFGVYYALVYPALAFMLLFPRLLADARRSLVRRVGLAAMAIWLIILPWYAYKLVDIVAGRDGAAFDVYAQSMTIAHARGGLANQALHAAKALAAAFGWTFFVLAFLGSALRFRPLRAITLLFVLPLTALWIFIASYDFRNLTAAIVVLGFAAGPGVEPTVAVLVSWVAWARDRWPGRLGTVVVRTARRLRGWHLAVAGGILLVILSSIYTTEWLVRRQRVLEEQVGIPVMNEKLFGFLERYDVKGGTMLSAYVWACTIPRITDRLPCEPLHMYSPLYYGASAKLVRKTVMAGCAPVYVVIPETDFDTLLGWRAGQNIRVTVLPLDHGRWKVFLVERAGCPGPGLPVNRTEG
jgi:hypothetical protein